MVKLFEFTDKEVQVDNQEKVELPLIKSPQESFMVGKVGNQV